MQVIFNLNAGQKAAAQAIVNEIKKEQGSTPTPPCFYAGNLQGWKPIYENTNANISVNFVGGKMIVDGERCPFIQDNHLFVCESVMGNCDYAKWGVEYYKTSDRSLKWWETKEAQLLDAIKNGRYTLLNLAKDLEALKIKGGDLKLSMPQWLQTAGKAILENVSILPNPATPAYRQCMADGSYQAKRRATKVKNMYLDMGGWVL